MKGQHTFDQPLHLKQLLELLISLCMEMARQLLNDTVRFILVHTCVFSLMRVKLSRMLLHDPPTSPVVET